MKIEIAEEGGKKKTLYIPLFKPMAGIVAWAMNKNRKNFLDHINSIDSKKHLTEDEIEIEDMKEEDINSMQEHVDNLPSKKELKEFFSKSIEILKEHKGLVLVEVADSDGDYVKITL
ncbi:MAG: hypothetical protein IKD35_02015 [Clostridia bacterium]|nr:hypothetical protein [Clostridia bacterium]